MPFKASAEESTLKGNSKMFARLLCSVIRMVDEGHSWCHSYPFDDEQLAAMERLSVAIEAEAEDASDYAVMEAIHEFGLTLWCKERADIKQGDFACPVYRFLVITAIKDGGNFMLETDITNMIAKLQWGCRAMIYEEMLRRMERMPEHEAWSQLGPYLKEGNYTAFNSIRQIMHLASNIAYGSSSMPQIEWLDDSHEKASIHGKPVALDDIRRFVFERLEVATRLLEKEVLFGHKFEVFGYTCGRVVDVLSNRKIGYSFIDSPDNGFVKFKNKPLETLLNDPLIGPFFVKRVRAEKVEWNKDGCEKWLKRTKAFLEILMTVIHIVYGQPARAEELGTVMIRNQLNGMRGIFWSRERVMLTVGYTKTRSTTGKDKLIARYLPKGVGDLLVKYLSIVRPMEAFIAEQIESEAFDKYEKMLYTDHERAWSGRQLSEIFMRQMNEWGPVAMGFQEYRQVAISFMRKHLKESTTS